ncbi:hypothetical protein B296_00010774 [Ensete ventricosum]|uniref:Uncharacterized protein n=1 Tax=Ensete ventricosum TaxID=4639 RepID=A0A426ZNV6_ENSVE|nr:hypothetical protein B296_00010774 [Ensete ventricosum]
MTDPGFPPPMSNPVPFVIMAETFLGHTNQVQALAGMVQTITPYLPQLIQSVTPQSAPLVTPSQMESPVAPNREVQLEIEVLQCWTTEVHADSPVVPARSQSHSRDMVQASPNLDTLSSKEVLKSKGEVEESSKGGSPFTPEIQDKPLPTNFRLPALELYDGDCDPTEHVATFCTQMALYDTSDVLMCRAFPTTLRRPART